LGHDGPVVLGAIILAIVIVIVLPIAFMLSGAVVAGLLGWSLRTWGEDTHEGSELLDTNY
jgi:hypothetical protein